MSQAISKILPSLFLWQSIAVATGFVTQIVLARSLGPHDKGILDLFLLIPVVAASVTEFGLLSANTYFAGKGKIDLRILHSNSVVWSIGIGALVLAIGIGVHAVIGSPFASLTGGFFLLALAATAPSLYYSFWSGLMYGSDETKKVYFISGLYSIISLIIYGAAIGLGIPLEWLLPLSGALIFMKSGLSLFALRSMSPLHLQFNAQALKQSLIYGLALYAGLAVNTLHFRADQFFVNSMLGATHLGYYALAVRIAELVWLLDYVVVMASLYRVTSSSRADAVVITQRSLRLVAVLVIPLSLAIFALAPVIVPLLFGEAFQPSVLPLWLLLPGIVSWSLARSLSPFIAYQCGKPWYNTLAAFIAFTVNLGANVLLIPRMGVAGAALASSISYALNLVIVALIFSRLSHARFTETFLPKREDFVLVIGLAKEKYLQFVGRTK